jgi:hypothetical protein
MATSKPRGLIAVTYEEAAREYLRKSSAGHRSDTPQGRSLCQPGGSRSLCGPVNVAERKRIRLSRTTERPGRR